MIFNQNGLKMAWLGAHVRLVWTSQLYDGSTAECSELALLKDPTQRPTFIDDIGFCVVFSEIRTRLLLAQLQSTQVILVGGARILDTLTTPGMW